MSQWIELDSLIQHYKELRDTIVETDEFGLHPVPIENMIGLLRTYQGTALPDIIRCRECIHYHPCEAELIDGSAPDAAHLHGGYRRVGYYLGVTTAAVRNGNISLLRHIVMENTNGILF